MIWSSIKAKLYIGITLLVGALLAALRIQSARLKKSQKKARELGARNKHAKRVRKQERENQIEFDSRTAELAKEIEKSGTSKELSDPNKW